MGLFKIGWWNTSLRPPRQRPAPSDNVLATAQTILDLFLEEQIDLLGLGEVGEDELATFQALPELAHIRFKGAGQRNLAVGWSPTKIARIRVGQHSITEHEQFVTTHAGVRFEAFA